MPSRRPRSGGGVAPPAAPDRAAAAAAIVRAGRRLADAGLVAGPDGNVSVRFGDAQLLVTPSGASKGELREQDLVLVDLDGRPAAGERGRPSSELALHLALYRARPDAAAVVHAHPPTATGFALAGEDLMAPLLPEVILQAGGVPLVPYALPGSQALADAVACAAERHDALLLANHGAVAIGATLETAVQVMESLEHAARIVLVARQLGRVTPLTSEQVQALTARRAAERGAGAGTRVQESAG